MIQTGALNYSIYHSQPCEFIYNLAAVLLHDEVLHDISKLYMSIARVILLLGTQVQISQSYEILVLRSTPAPDINW